MMLSGRLPSFFPISSTHESLLKQPLLSKPSPTRTVRRKSNKNHNSGRCRATTTSDNAAAAPYSYSITDYDLYDLLGVDSSCNRSQLKLAYRSLQKRCHPDIAGPPGHDMAIVLNEAYAVLSDPTTRFAYDKEQSKFSELRGYTGKPIYSVWFGTESEQRAVFVDEVKCIGCLKCALFAEKTFAVESVYGRARVVAQWADPEHKIQEAIESCPVDCISIVERSNLAALEFLMSKQPRGKVQIGAGNTVGACVSNIFVDVDKFEARYRDAMEKASNIHAKESVQKESRISAIQAIKAISNWLYWQPPNSRSQTSQVVHQYLAAPPTAQKSANPNIDKLRDVAAARKQARETSRPIPSNSINGDEYWTPLTLALPQETQRTFHSGSSVTPRLSKELKEESQEELRMRMNSVRNPFEFGVPLGIATVAAIIVRSHVRDGITAGDIKEHIGGSLALSIVNSTWLQAVLAGLMWYCVGVVGIAFVQALKSNIEPKRKREDNM